MNHDNLIKELETEGFSKNIIDAFKKVDRKKFVPQNLISSAYLNKALPLGKGSSISQPYTIAFMLYLLDLKDHQKILEIGSGSGYVLELINELSLNSKIFGIDINEKLIDSSKKLIKHSNIEIIQGDGRDGYLKEAPYDRILVSAAFSKTPTKLFEQIKDGGIIVCPINNSIFKFKKISNQIISEHFSKFVFVKMQ